MRVRAAGRSGGSQSPTAQELFLSAGAALWRQVVLQRGDGGGGRLIVTSLEGAKLTHT